MHRALTLIVASAAFCEVCSAVQGTDEELRRDVLEFLTTRCCGNVEARRVLTNEVRFGGDTNRLACVLSEFAQTNDDQIAEWAMWHTYFYDGWLLIKETRHPAASQLGSDAAGRRVSMKKDLYMYKFPLTGGGEL